MRRFILGLARELKYTVRDLLSSLSSRELTEWMAYFELEEERLEQDKLAHLTTASVQARKAKNKWQIDSSSLTNSV